MDALRRKIQTVGIKLKLKQEDYCEFLGCSRSNLYNVTWELTPRFIDIMTDRLWIAYSAIDSDRFEQILSDAYHRHMIIYHTRLLSNYN